MPFPKADRVRYKKNPLVEVICELTFPPILKIDKEKPAEFQEKIQATFPLYEELEQDEVTFDPEAKGALKSRTYTLHQFKTENNESALSLSSESIAISTSEYNQWEDFRSICDRAFDSFIQEYPIKHFSRIGIRYRNIISKSELGIEKNLDWNALINKTLLGFLAVDEISKEIVKAHEGTFIIELKEKTGLLSATYGLVRHTESGEVAFAIDGDFCTLPNTETPGEKKDVFKKLEIYRETANRFFQMGDHRRAPQKNGA